MSSTRDQVRWTVHFSGKVQGVGFRFTTERLAAGREVTGTVRNLPDGRVEMVAEGTENALESFLAAIESTFRGYISGRQKAEMPATGQFVGFRVAY